MYEISLQPQPSSDLLMAFTPWLHATLPDQIWDWPHLVYCRKRLARLTTGEIDRLAFALPPQHGKPLSECSLVLLASGARVRLDAIRVGDRVISHTGRPCRVSAVHIQGPLECVRVSTELGRSTVAALDHPFLTPAGWVDAGELRPGMALATVPCPKTEPTQSSRKVEEFRLAGYFVGDGSCSHSNSLITNIEPALHADFEKIGAACGFTVRVGALVKGRIETYLFSNGIRQWLRDAGLAGCTSHTKRVPWWVFEGTNEQIANFVAAYYDCDGVLSGRGMSRNGGMRKDPCIEFSSVHRELLCDVQHLLLRLGIRARIARKNGRYNGKPHLSWRLAITSQNDAAVFASVIHPKGGRGDRLRACDSLLRTRFDSQYIEDRITAVERVGTFPCRCLTVDEDHTFTSDDFVVHNTKSLVCPYLAWRMLREPGLRVGVGSHTQSYANKIGRAISRIIALAGGEMGEVRQAADWHLTNGSTFIAKGVGSALAGESIDLFAMDDVFGSRETADSVAHQERVYEWYMDDVVPRLQQDAGLLFVNCLAGDTIITLANGSARPIHAIRPGDRVVSHAPSGPVVQTVTAFVPQPAADLYEIVTPAARVRATSRHPFLVASESGPVYRPVSALRAGDRLHQLTDAGFATTPILGIYPAGREPVYDLTVSGSENFIADGLVSHNTRWSPGDLIGRLQQAEEWSMWEYHRLPAIAEEGDPLGRAVGEALCPERYPIEKLLQRRRIEGLGFESLYQGHPVPRGGTFFRREWFRLVPSAPHCRMIRWWDLASSRKDDACYTSGVLMGHEPNTDNYFVIDVVRGRWSPADRNEIMLQTAIADAQQRGFERTYFESPPYDRDHAAERAIIAKLAGYAVRPDPVTGSKEMRAEPVAGAAKSGLISLVQASWNSAFLGEIEAFPRGQYLDQVDSLSGCYNRLTRSENKYIMAVV